MPNLMESDVHKQIISGMKWMAGLKFVGQLYGWIVTFAVVRILSPSDFGLNSMIEAPVEILLLVAVIGIDGALIKFRVTGVKELASVFGFLLISNFTIAVLLFLSANLFASYFKQEALVPLIQVSAVVFILVPFRVIPDALLDLNLDFKLKAKIDVASSLASSTVSLFVAINGGGVWALMSALLVNPLLKTILLSVFRPWIIIPEFYFRGVSMLLKYGFQLVAGSALAVLSGKLLIAIIGPKIGAENLGFYSVAVMLSMLPLNKLMPVIQQTLLPAYSRFQNDDAILRKYILKAVELSLLLMMPLSVAMAFHSEAIIRILLGEKWLKISDVFAALSLLLVLRLANFIFHTPLIATGHAKFVTVVQAIGFVTIVGGAFVAGDFGLKGLVILSVINTTLLAIVMTIACTKIFDIRYKDYAKSIYPAFIGTLCMFISLFIVNLLPIASNYQLHLSLATVIGTCTYFASINLALPQYWINLYKTFRNPSKSADTIN